MHMHRQLNFGANPKTYCWCMGFGCAVSVRATICICLCPFLYTHIIPVIELPRETLQWCQIKSHMSIAYQQKKMDNIPTATSHFFPFPGMKKKVRIILCREWASECNTGWITHLFLVRCCCFFLRQDDVRNSLYLRNNHMLRTILQMYVCVCVHIIYSYRSPAFIVVALKVFVLQIC